MHAASSFPSRIVCLTEETTEALYLLGEDWRIVGISGFTVRPSRARKEKPRVSAFTSAKLDRIVALEPDLVLGGHSIGGMTLMALAEHRPLLEAVRFANAAAALSVTKLGAQPSAPTRRPPRPRRPLSPPGSRTTC